MVCEEILSESPTGFLPSYSLKDPVSLRQSVTFYKEEKGDSGAEV